MFREKVIAIPTVVAALFFMMAIQFMVPHLEFKAMGYQMVLSGMAYADAPTTDLSAPSNDIKFALSRMKGDENAVYLNIPSAQFSDKFVLPQEPSGTILAKYDPSTNTGSLAVMRMRMVGGVIQAQILRITPQNFQTHLSPHFYNFSWLDWTGNAGCNIGDKMLVGNDPPNIDNVSIIRQFIDYDMGRSSIEPIVILGGEQDRVNKSNYYWHQRLNNDSCWSPIGLKAFDTGDGNFHNVSFNGFLNIVAFA